MLRGAFRNFRGWLGFAPTFSGVKTGENLNTKETHVGMNREAALDRSSTLLTSIFRGGRRNGDRFSFATIGKKVRFVSREIVSSRNFAFGR